MIAAIVLLLLSAAEPAGPPDATKGRSLAVAHCSGCHAVGSTGASPRLSAPPFRLLHTRYPVEALQEALAEGIVTGHPEMPQFALLPREIDDFVAYLKTLERAGPAGARRR